jgi:hypothetical protein
MATVTKKQREIAFAIRKAAKNADKKKEIDLITKPFSKDEVIEKYFREKAQPKKVNCFTRNFY